jgi:energy-coupling factor transporter ATP-binding protein EcfA2
MPADPHEIYSQLLAGRLREIAAQERRHRALGYCRLAVALAGCVLAWLALVDRALSFAWTLAPLAGFIALVATHERLLRRTERKRRAARYCERALARLDGRWAGVGEAGERYLDPAHPYAQDLDLFGRGSLFELLCSARTHVGEDTLARWLLAPAAPETVRARQRAVEELRGRLDLREALAVVAEEARTGVDPIALADWGEGKGPALDTRKMLLQVRVLAALGLLAAAAGIALLANAAGSAHLSERAAALLRDGLLVVLAANGYYLYSRHKLFSAVVSAVEEAAHELGLLSEVLLLLERETFRSPLLTGLRASLDAEGGPPSRHLARLKRLVEYLDSRDNVFVRVAELFILWTPHWALKVEDWRHRSGPAVRRWLNATGEIEALSSLASHAFEHPADAFPELSDAGLSGEANPRLQAEQVAHPLLPEARAVRNDVSLGGRTRLLVVSGSNMSGKSTLLRTLGTNAVLAQSGAPVRARRMVLAPMAVGASIRVTDSLQGGVSRFYAEILRLRQILDLTAGPLPVLFLIDEFFHGTNSHDRRIGAEALVRGLLQRGAFGLVTTHDLALAEIVESLDGRGANVHFEDHIENGQIHFDYVMRPGVVRKSNAIELMRSVGLVS